MRVKILPKRISIVKGKDRYDTSGFVEAQFQPGSRGRVLKNLLGIASKKEMERVEAEEHFRALDKLVRIYSKEHQFTSADICGIHKIWLGRIYEWAGQYRRINLSKGGFPFAAAAHIPKLMGEFEREYLRKYTPCLHDSMEKVAEALAVVHSELLLIHPFREGNGRLARMLAVLMALQADYPSLDFGGLVGKKKKDYIAAVHAALDKNYQPMREIFISVLRRTLRGQKKT